MPLVPSHEKDLVDKLAIDQILEKNIQSRGKTELPIEAWEKHVIGDDAELAEQLQILQDKLPLDEYCMVLLNMLDYNFKQMGERLKYGCRQTVSAKWQEVQKIVKTVFAEDYKRYFETGEDAHKNTRSEINRRYYAKKTGRSTALDGEYKAFKKKHGL